MDKGVKIYNSVSSFMLAVCFFLCYVGTETMQFRDSIIISLVSGSVLSALFLLMSRGRQRIVGWGAFVGSMASLVLLITDSVLRTVTEMKYGFSFGFHLNIYRAVPLLLMFTAAFAVVILTAMFRRKQNENDFVSAFRIMSVAALVFTVILYAVCFGIQRKVGSGTTVNIVPFRTMGEYLSWYRHGNWIEPMIQFFGNIMFFFIFGFYGQICFPKLKKIFLCVFPIILSGGIELSQYLLKNGNCDIDDVILNVFGFFLGWGVMICLEIINSLIKNSDDVFLTFRKKKEE